MPINGGRQAGTRRDLARSPLAVAQAPLYFDFLTLSPPIHIIVGRNPDCTAEQMALISRAFKDQEREAKDQIPKGALAPVMAEHRLAVAQQQAGSIGNAVRAQP